LHEAQGRCACKASAKGRAHSHVTADIIVSYRAVLCATIKLSAKNSAHSIIGGCGGGCEGVDIRDTADRIKGYTVLSSEETCAKQMTKIVGIIVVGCAPNRGEVKAKADLTCAPLHSSARAPHCVRLRRQTIRAIASIITLADHRVTINHDGVTLAWDRGIGEPTVVRQTC